VAEPHIMNRLATQALLWYARHIPYHRGKTRLSGYLRAAFGVHLDGETVERRDGLWWCFDRADYMCQDLYWSGSNDRAELREALRAMPPGGVMLDVGANFGFYSIAIAARLRQHCLIHAFEPNPATFDRLQKNIRLNTSRAVTAHEMGVSDRAGHAAVVEVRGHSGAAYLGPGADVVVTTLDDFCEHAHVDRVDLIKIDAEGAELRILRGAARVLHRCRPTILLELNAPTLEREHSSPAQVLAHLRAFGYRVYTISPKAEIQPDAGPLPREIMNVICHRTAS
jgi:FkbM family methyltransferase